MEWINKIKWFRLTPTVRHVKNNVATLESTVGISALLEILQVRPQSGIPGKVTVPRMVTMDGRHLKDCQNLRIPCQRMITISRTITIPWEAIRPLMVTFPRKVIFSRIVTIPSQTGRGGWGHHKYCKKIRQLPAYQCLGHSLTVCNAALTAMAPSQLRLPKSKIMGKWSLFAKIMFWFEQLFVCLPE